jgi:hypothetical protein
MFAAASLRDMYEQVSATLYEAIDQLDIPVDGAALKQCFQLYDLFTAKLTTAVGAFNQAEAWRDSGATSMTAWLKHHCRRSGREAKSFSKIARLLDQLPGAAAAYADGRLSTGQIQAIAVNVTDKTAPLFAEHENDLIPQLVSLPVNGVATVMQAWASAAKDFLDEKEPPVHERSLHASRTLDGRIEISGSLDPEGGAVLELALRLAQTDDVEGEPPRTPAEKRADALVDMCRQFLDRHDEHTGGRNRPHLNVIVDYDDLIGDGDGELIDGTKLDADTIKRLACDAGIHRIVMKGQSEILDYGRRTRTISQSLWDALVLRDRHCRFPGCDRGPEWCEVHHIPPWSEGGETKLETTLLGCTRHHHVFHSAGWTLKLWDDGTLEITDPNGNTLISQPPGKPPDLFDGSG